MSLLALSLAILAWAPDQLEPAPAPRPGAGGAASTSSLPPTRLATELLSGEPLVVVGRTVSARNLPVGTAVVHLTVEESLTGGQLSVGDVAVVFAYAGDFVAGSRNLVYLKAQGTGGRWAVVQRIDGRDPDFSAKVAVTRSTIALKAVLDPAAREDATFELLFGLLGRPDAWSRGYALTELRWLARRHRPLFTELRARRLQLIAAGSPHGDVAPGVESVAILLSLNDDSLRRTPQSESSSR